MALEGEEGFEGKGKLVLKCRSGVGDWWGELAPLNNTSALPTWSFRFELYPTPGLKDQYTWCGTLYTRKWYRRYSAFSEIAQRRGWGLLPVSEFVSTTCSNPPAFKLLFPRKGQAAFAGLRSLSLWRSGALKWRAASSLNGGEAWSGRLCLCSASWLQPNLVLELECSSSGSIASLRG